MSSHTFAVIKTGGKQYKVENGHNIKIEKLNAKEGDEIVFDNVLLVNKESNLKIGAPFVSEAKVIGKVLQQFKGEKQIIFKYKPKKRYKK
ncbi:MAG: 50S ribosomal protein L21, partial [Patescibacteria group bacterium]